MCATRTYPYLTESAAKQEWSRRVTARPQLHNTLQVRKKLRSNYDVFGTMKAPLALPLVALPLVIFHHLVLCELILIAIMDVLRDKDPVKVSKVDFRFVN